MEKLNIPFLTGQNIDLRTLCMEDVEGDYPTWFNDEEINIYNEHHIFPYTKENASKYIKDCANCNNKLVLAIEHKQEHKHIGNVSLQNIHFINRSAEFAIIIGNKDFHGKGYGKEAGNLILKHGFISLNLNRIYCGTSVYNIAMQKLALYLGMKEEGRRRQAIYKDGKYVDVLDYAVLKDDYYRK